MIRSKGILGALLFASAFVSSRAEAESTKRQCIHSAERAQQFRLDGKLMSARAELFTCVRAACPAVVRSQCTRWFDQVEAATPSVVIRVHDDAGNDLDDVAVAVDGKPIDNWRGGLPVLLDPGEHTFAYSRAGSAPIQNRVMLGTSEKNRLLTVTIPGAAAQSPQSPQAHEMAGTTSSSSSGSEEAASPSSRGPSAVTWVFAGASLVALGTFAYFGATGQGELNDLRSTCGNRCARSDIDAAWNKLVVADVALGVGVAAAGVATVLFFTTRGSKERAAAPTSAFRIAPSTHGVGVLWDARF